MKSARIRSKPSGLQHFNQRRFFDDLGKQIGVQKLDDWYQKLNKKVIVQHGGKEIYQHHSSAIDALMSSYPEHDWIPWKFGQVGRKFWISVDNQRNFFSWLGKEIGVVQMEDWYDVLNTKKVLDYGGYFINVYYKGSAFEALKACYPQHDWLPWKFKKLGKHFWRSLENQKQFFDWLGFQLGVNTLDDWYSIAQAELILKHGGTFVKSIYHGSPMLAIMAAYPTHNWIPWKFQHCDIPAKYWESKDSISKLLSELSDKLCIQTLDDWYRVNTLQLQQLGVWHILRSLGGIYHILRQHYPDHPWELARFRTGRKTQRWLYVTLQKIYPGHEIIEDYRHPKAFFQATKMPVQLDMFLPSLSLAFEYQGQQHYQDVGVFQPQKVYHQRDQEKRALCEQLNIKLIEVPYWWDRSDKALIDIIHTSNNQTQQR